MDPWDPVLAPYGLIPGFVEARGILDPPGLREYIGKVSSDRKPKDSTDRKWDLGTVAADSAPLDGTDVYQRFTAKPSNSVRLRGSLVIPHHVE